MYRWIIFGFFLITIASSIFAQNFQSVQNKGLAGAAVALKSPYILDENPVSIGFYSTAQISFTQQLDYSISDLQANQLAFLYPYHSKYFGIAWYSSKFYDYQYNRLVANIASKINSKTLLGIKINWIQEKNLEKRENTLLPEIGICYQVSKKNTLGIHLVNINNSKNSQQTASEIRIGITSILNTQLTATAAYYYTSESKMALRTGLIYTPTKSIEILIGISTNASNYGFGLAYTYKRTRIQLSSAMHINLGLSPSCSVVYEW